MAQLALNSHERLPVEILWQIKRAALQLWYLFVQAAVLEESVRVGGGLFGEVRVMAAMLGFSQIFQNLQPDVVNTSFRWLFKV